MKIPGPTRDEKDRHYETELRSHLEPLFEEILSKSETAGWNRRKVAYTMMFLAANDAAPKGK